MVIVTALLWVTLIPLLKRYLGMAIGTVLLRVTRTTPDGGSIAILCYPGILGGVGDL